MVPIAEYAVVSQDATLRDAVLELEAAQERYAKAVDAKDGHPHHHRAILVSDGNDNPVGKISQWVVLRAIAGRWEGYHAAGRRSSEGPPSMTVSSSPSRFEIW